jgi:capsular exopolysaccharide synthesis family protein
MEAFETLRSSLTYFNVDRPLSTLVVASAAQQDGKTTVAVNLAVAFARDGRDVILLDGDLRFPQVASRLGREVTAGLDTVLVGESSLEEALIDVDAGGGRLRILPGAGGAPNPAVLLGSQRMRTLLAELEEISDIIVIDSPAILAVSDAMPLINAAAGTILVARVDKTQKEAVERMAQLASSAGGVVLGSVATGGRGGGVYGYYGYYRDGNNGHAQKPKPPVGTGLRDGVNGSENGSKVGVNPPPGS